MSVKLYRKSVHARRFVIGHFDGCSTQFTRVEGTVEQDTILVSQSSIKARQESISTIERSRRGVVETLVEGGAGLEHVTDGSATPPVVTDLVDGGIFLPLSMHSHKESCRTFSTSVPSDTRTNSSSRHVVIVPLPKLRLGLSNRSTQ